jgi:hypothetical protein
LNKETSAGEATAASKKVLTRRANHRHIFTIARISEPAPGNRRRAFDLDFFESDGGRNARHHILPMHAARSVTSGLPSELHYWA